MDISFYLFEYMFYFPVLIYKEGLAGGPPFLFTVHILLNPDAVFLHHLFMGVRQKSKGQVKLFAKPGMRFFIIDGYAQDLDPFPLEGTEIIPE